MLTLADNRFQNYTVDGQRTDQYLSGNGTQRPGWQPLASHINSLDAGGINRTIKSVSDSIRKNDVTLRDDGSRERQWRLSAFPTVVDHDAWRVLQDGLIDRTSILELILNDLLGARKLISAGVVPSGVLWHNPIFHRAYTTLPAVPERPRMDLVSFDVTRIGDTQWQVIGDRTRAPSGLGYLLENRIATGNVYGSAMRSTQTRRVAAWFDRLRTHLRSLSAESAESPRVVLLTPRTERYRQFEDSFLSRYLGLTLVQGTDLAVRGDHLFLKTLGGLLPIDVVWRHISDRRSDPLELSPRSNEGVSGLLRVVRQGNVSVANAIGSGLAQTPALLPYVNAASKFLTGREPILPTAESWWCGDPKSLPVVLQNFDAMVIKPAFRIGQRPTAFVSEMDAASKDKLRREILHSPHRFAASVMPAYATTPVFQNGALKPWRMIMKCYTLQDAAGTSVLPGALVRLSPSDRELSHSAIGGSLTQDCWVTSDDQVDQSVTLLAPDDRIPKIKRTGDELPSRVAEQLFWLGRYGERAESIARLLRVTLNRLSDQPDRRHLPEFQTLVSGLAALGQIEPAYALAGMDRTLPLVDQAIIQSIVDPQGNDGLHRSLEAAIENSRSVRDRLSIDAYRILHRTQRHWTIPSENSTASQPKASVKSRTRLRSAGEPKPSKPNSASGNLNPSGQTSENGRVDSGLPATTIPPQPPAGSVMTGGAMTGGAMTGGVMTSGNSGGPLLSEVPIADLVDRLNHVIEDLLAFAGVTGESFTRSGAWFFLQLGRRMERASQTAELLSATMTKPSADDTRIIEAVLDTCDSQMTYRSRYRNSIHAAPTLDLLVTDQSNPRSIRYQISDILQLLRRLPEPFSGPRSDIQMATSLDALIDSVDPTKLAALDNSGARPALQRLMVHIIDELPRLGRMISGLYLIHTTVRFTGDDMGETGSVNSWKDMRGEADEIE